MRTKAHTHPAKHDRNRRRHSKRRLGIATLWLVISIIVLFAFFVLAADWLYIVGVGRQLSAGADSAALAGTLDVRRSRSDARDEAVAFALANTAAGDNIVINRNDGNAADGHVVIGRFRRADQSFTPLNPGEGTPNAVRVRAPRTSASAGGPVPTLFMSMFGVNSFNVTRTATAMIGGDIGPGVIALNPTASCSLDLRGSTVLLQVNDGVVVVNSNNGTAACHSGHPDIDAEELHVHGGTDNGFDQVDLEGELFLGSDPVPDPLAALPEPNAPSVNHGNRKLNGNQTVTIDPGQYGDLEISGNADVTFNPGLYYITGEFKVNGGAVDATAGVMIFIAPGGNIDIAGMGQFHLSPMVPIVYPNGPAVPAELQNVEVPIFQSRNNTNTAEFNGTPDWMLEGTIYIPSGLLEVYGTPGTFANGLIADRLDFRGTSDVIIDFEGQFPPIPRFVFLVE